MITKRALVLPALFALILSATSFSARSAVAAPVAQQIAQTGDPVACHTFPETNQTVGGVFLQYWNAHGGLAQQGYPISAPFVETSPTNGQQYTVQYFERAVFEYHPENQAPNDVLLSLLGSFIYNQKYPQGAPNQVPNKSGGAQFFPETGHWLGGGFLEYWNAHGGLAQQGYPISDEFDEVSPTNGQVYRVQYFQRAVFEYHPENNPANRIQLSLLGRFTFTQNYPNGVSSDKVVQQNCAADSDGDGIVDTDDKCPNQPENINGIFDTDGCPDTMQDLIDSAASDINNYWQQTLTGSGARYIPPEAVVPYSQAIRTGCGRATPNNAFYCGADDTVYYDINFLTEQLNEIGDFAPVVIIAHEWGHLIQADLGILGAGYPTIYTELQADCFAGSWAQHADAEKLLDPGDVDEGVTALFAGGDPAGTPWFDPQAHGTSQQRVSSFQTGFSKGPQACIDQQIQP